MELEKICEKCNISKPLNKFSGQTEKKYVWCRECCRANPEEHGELRIKLRKIRDSKRDNSLRTKQKKEWYERTKEDRKEHVKEVGLLYRINNPDKIKKRSKKYYLNNKDKIKIKDRIYAVKNKNKITIRARKWNSRNRERVRKNRKMNFKKYMRNPIYRFKVSLRRNIGRSLKRKNVKKVSKTQEILGCTFEEFRIYMENSFESWMTWENYGHWNGMPTEPNTAWDIEHKIPVCRATTEEEVIKLNHYTNLMPLCSYVNRYVKNRF